MLDSMPDFDAPTLLEGPRRVSRKKSHVVHPPDIGSFCFVFSF
jgi:hypothetical protein